MQHKEKHAGSDVPPVKRQTTGRTGEAMFSSVAVTGAFKRRVSRDQQHDASTRQCDVTFQIETKAARQHKHFPLRAPPRRSEVSYLFDFLHAL